SAGKASEANRHLMQVERALLRPAGLSGRPWVRNLTVAADYRNGYANIMLPGIAEAGRDKDWSAMGREAVDLAGRIDAAAGQLRQAAAALR
ncbi:MAG TPA: transferrin receptor-like dimerization domain-containing protein, partial [Longimicrobiales bacterium]